MKSKIYAEQELTDEEKKQKEELKEDAKQLSVLRQGTVTEITMGGQTFQVSDPKRIEQAISFLERHEESLFTLRQRIKEQNKAINVLIQEIEKLKADVQRLKEESNNGFGSQEYSNY
ncbi:putative structural protein [Erwinia phage pEa_SNUABM_50]|uniref:Structural protein n=4 Tax=Eneladusvirus BF TaxID=2560751 RepID=A0A1S6UBL3_9CAUD|nr:virion structural protein [Serratia phage BF]QOI71221.1 putative structural protein [Erwinia phage pEa_SNUABM_12]QOI71765.1 putative structural protein [Erwinia phage pEa_SNUABM_47]QOI72304.1 putative structural protein [Erwinia phage pEa_SNUABM_50]QXO11430.1 hypothetical protein pEaSNUABM19_00284 [Erwinia phage pEa_SNUABM_19]QXO11978.1 hypothetical protein pEaSNUABM44_00282 [Erwinia phage pEa_SNUABM_44]QXO12531.1 hypothetical protein pEaSNUABM49_00285 [Erwinia phage pEa_SNUABM_49]